MRPQPLRAFAWSLFVLLCTAPLHAADTKRLVVPCLATGPALRGDLSDGAWKGAATTGRMGNADGVSPVAAATEAFVLAGPDSLYVGFACDEPHVAKLVTETSGRDGPVYTDDCVEIILDPPRGKTWCYHFAVNVAGVIWDELHLPSGKRQGYSATATARGKVHPDRWTCEVRIPFADIGGKPLPGEVWGINLCRERRAGEKLELSSWSPAPAGFATAGDCGEMLFPAGPGPLVLQRVARGAVCADANETGLNVFSLSATNAAAQPATLQAEVTVDGKAVATRSMVVPPGPAVPLALPYSMPTAGQPQCGFVVRLDGREAYRSQLVAAKPTQRGPRTWTVPDPLFTPLLSDQPPGLRRVGVMFWGHLNNVKSLQEVARRFAVRYTEDEAYREHADHGLMLIGHGVVRDLTAASPFARWKVRNVPVSHRAPEGVPWILDPRAVDHNLGQIKDVFAGPHPLVFGIFAGDEVEDAALSQGAHIMARPDDYKYRAEIEQANEEVKRDFGGGKWGIPLGIVERDPNPYKWIAYRRWVNAKLRERHRRLRELVRAHDASMPLISVDSGGGIHSYEYSSQAELFDIFTAQTSCRAEQWRAQPGCQSKIVADLTGKEFWPCVHIENYGMNTTPEEAVSELSQAFRNGATGLHLYMPDTANAGKLVGDTWVSTIGSPRRWHTVMNIVDLLRTMPPLRFPTYDRTAVLFNDDTLQATPYDATRPFADQIEACYTMLGPVARSWFKFIDCAQVLNWPSLKQRFDTLYLPCARYQRPEIVAKLRAFVEEGGTLVCGDPQAFTTDILGNDTAACREELFGVKVEATTGVRWLTPTSPDIGAGLPLTGDTYCLVPGPGVAVLGAYEDGSAAITAKARGKGRAILFGTNPFILGAVADSQWRKFATAWATSLGQPTGLDIWRFEFPPSVIWREPQHPGFCLTNNHVVWREEKPYFDQDKDTGGSYSYSVAPDAMADMAGANTPIGFATGHLTDRRVSMMAPKAAARPYAPFAQPADRWMVSWATPEPVAVTFDLKQTWRVNRLILWLCDTMPELKVEGSADGQTWRQLGEHKGLEAGADVWDAEVALTDATGSRYVRLACGARQPGQKLSLIEAEVWGE